MPIFAVLFAGVLDVSQPVVKILIQQIVSTEVCQLKFGSKHRLLSRLLWHGKYSPTILPCLIKANSNNPLRT